MNLNNLKSQNISREGSPPLASPVVQQPKNNVSPKERQQLTLSQQQQSLHFQANQALIVAPLQYPPANTPGNISDMMLHQQNSLQSQMSEHESRYRPIVNKKWSTSSITEHPLLSQLSTNSKAPDSQMQHMQRIKSQNQTETPSQEQIESAASRILNSNEQVYFKKFRTITAQSDAQQQAQEPNGKKKSKK